MSNEPDNVNSGALATMIVLVAFTTLAVALVVTALVRQETSRLRAEGDAQQDRPFRQLRSEQESKLSDAPAWVDKQAGLVSIPIKSAKDLVIESVRKNPLELSPGNDPEEEEEDEEEASEEGEESAQDDASSEGEQTETPGDAQTPGDAEVSAEAPAPAPKPELVPKTAPSPKPEPAKAPAPQPTPAPGGASE